MKSKNFRMTEFHSVFSFVTWACKFALVQQWARAHDISFSLCHGRSHREYRIRCLYSAIFFNLFIYFATFIIARLWAQIFGRLTGDSVRCLGLDGGDRMVFDIVPKLVSRGRSGMAAFESRKTRGAVTPSVALYVAPSVAHPRRRFSCTHLYCNRANSSLPEQYV
jgi:hypothetical protein